MFGGCPWGSGPFQTAMVPARASGTADAGGKAEGISGALSGGGKGIGPPDMPSTLQPSSCSIAEAASCADANLTVASFVP